jgi:hypothetical protein
MDDASGFRFTGPRFGGTAIAASTSAGTPAKADEFAAEPGVEVAFIPRVVAHIPSREHVAFLGNSGNFGARLRLERLEDPMVTLESSSADMGSKRRSNREREQY